jgi:hypothetical protein
MKEQETRLTLHEHDDDDDDEKCLCNVCRVLTKTERNDAEAVSLIEVHYFRNTDIDQKL